MGACVSTHQNQNQNQKPVLFGADDINLAKEKPPIINGDLAPKPHSANTFRDFGSKEEAFFDSQAWLDSDCDDDFMSVNGEFTPSRGNTPVHHNFSTGTPLVNNGGTFSSGNNNKPPVFPEKKMRLSDLFKDSLRGNYDFEDEDGDKNGVKTETMAVDGGGVRTKRERMGCFPSLLSSRSSSTNGRKMMSPSPKSVLG